MKIAFDATVVHGSKSGVGYYSQELIRALADLGGSERYVAFSHRPLSDDVVRSPAVRFLSRGSFPVRAVYLHGILPALLEAESPDLVHYTNFLAPLRTDVPYVVTIHDMSLERHSRWHPLAKRVYTKRLVPHSAARARMVITNSEYSKWEIIRFLGIPEDRIRITPLAPSALFTPPPDTARAGIRNDYALERPYFLYVGNIDPRKNLVRLLEAFAHGPGSDFELVLVGTDWFGRREVVRTVKRLGLETSVRFLGYVPRAALPGLMAESVAMVYPSLLEGFGMPVIEAMATGTPVITSRTTALGEIAGEAALLVDPKNVDDIGAAMATVASNPDLRATLVRRGFARAHEFSWEQTAIATRSVYREAVDRRTVRVGRPPDTNRTADPAAIDQAVETTVRYARQFEFPMTPVEIHERLFAVRANPDEVAAAIDRLALKVVDGHVTESISWLETREARRQKTLEALEQAWPALGFVARFPYVRMLALSGATAHENMADDDIDLFAVVEDGRLWFVLGLITVWSKIRGLRRTICLNYIVSNRGLPLPDTDPFTAQQVASLKPVYGKEVYDAFIAANPFVFRQFPNFRPDLHRSRHPELTPARKRWIESLLRIGPAQIGELAFRRLLGDRIAEKARRSGGTSDVVLAAKRIKLHLESHREGALAAVASVPEQARRSASYAVAGAFGPDVGHGGDEHAKIHQH